MWYSPKFAVSIGGLFYVASLLGVFPHLIKIENRLVGGHHISESFWYVVLEGHLISFLFCIGLASICSYLALKLIQNIKSKKTLKGFDDKENW